MARPSPAALDVMEHIAEAMDVLQMVLVSSEHLEEEEILREVARAREELLLARMQGAEVLLELLNLSERHALMLDELAHLRTHVH